MTPSASTAPDTAAAGTTIGDGRPRRVFPEKPSTPPTNPVPTETEPFVNDWTLCDWPPCDPHPGALADAA